MKKTKILFYGDAPSCSTGFGTVARNILVPLQQSGKYDITILGINYWGEPNPYQKMFEMYPLAVMDRNRDPFGRQYAAELMRDLEYDLLFMVQDSFIMSFMNSAVPQLKQRGKLRPIVMYYPIDGIPKSEWIESMSQADVPVTYTEFGRTESVKAFPAIKDRLQVIPHGVNTNDFHPLHYDEVTAFRKNFFQGAADKHIFTNINRNQQRKDIPRTVMAFKEVRKLRPNSVLYLHMAPQDMGWDLYQLCRSFGLQPDRDVLFPKNFSTSRGYPVEVLNSIYNASDTVISTTVGEGWGLSSVEAMACKRPIIFPNNTSLKEIVGKDRGFLVDSGNSLDSWVVLPNDFEVPRPIVSLPDMIDKMIYVYDNPGEANKRAEAGYNWVTSNLNWERDIVPQWEKVIQTALSKGTKPGTVVGSQTVISVDDL